MRRTAVRIALIGTRGVPARYGGFETAVEEVGCRLVDRGHEVTVFCRTAGMDQRRSLQTRYRGMRLIHLPALHKRSLETLSHTALSVLHHSLARVDAAIIFNAANAPLLPILRNRRVPVATHVDGLEWMRSKWGPLGRRYYRLAESLAVRWSDALIADAEGIASYYRDEFGAATHLIAYGAPIIKNDDMDRLTELGVEAGQFHLVVARFEPENHVYEIVDGYCRSAAALPLVVVGSAPYADAYTAKIRAAADDRVHLLGGIWDQKQLDQLYAHAFTYLHGHSVGGTNPSLLRAVGAGTFTIAYDVNFNREVLAGNASYFTSAADIGAAIVDAERDPGAVAAGGRRLQETAKCYDWDDVAERYEELCLRLAGHEFPARRPSGRRLRSGLTPDLVVKTSADPQRQETNLA